MTATAGNARRVAVVGLGTISKYYLGSIHHNPSWTLAAVCDTRSAALKPHRSDTPCFRDHRTMFQEVDLDAVVVTVPNDVHEAVCRDALHAGIPVCVEKPLAVSLDDGRELAALADATGTPLFTAFHRRYNENVLHLADQVRRGGTIEKLTVRYNELIEDHIGADNWYLDPQRCGGGCVADNGPNAFDLVRMFLDDVTVAAASVRRDQHGTDRQAVIELRSATGIPATVELDWSHPGEIKDVDVLLSDGTRLQADMLAGHPGFKSSLWHEYIGILDDFDATISGATRDDGGLPALDLVAQSYHNERTGDLASEGQPR
ncbi:Gfo/Idh/MocA family oxidoreductase [Saccharopolyspora erythraea]|uniref:Gfo/Idh/MocA family protein n=1 Tax=Saccharopolyspora erythraea TaxID=1836 RepID=UPI001BA98C4B|nr:Gfo/Idh/MocA family oxidoreductase [Saccharopolyspora erythraea]QUH04210.1 Gfo/Idh/MocA family oxidoreductase [Saccharopolyspora erythraea]